MPCDSSHMNATGKEVALSRVACLLDELDGKPIDKCHWNGYHPKVYSKPVDADSLVSTLCSRLQDVDITQHSLEMQIWWRDHQKADKERLEREIEQQASEEAKQAALGKLTPYERRVLGL